HLFAGDAQNKQFVVDSWPTLKFRRRHGRLDELEEWVAGKVRVDKLLGRRQEIVIPVALEELVVFQDAGAPGGIDELPLAVELHGVPGVVALRYFVSRPVADAFGETVDLDDFQASRLTEFGE